MTRINAGVPVKNLCDSHLLAEHREIIRMCYLYKSWSKRSNYDEIPKEFTLGTGHMKFFLDKGLYTLNRYKELYIECQERGFNNSDMSSNWIVYREKDMNDYIPTEFAHTSICGRISQRLSESPAKPYYYGEPISLIKAIEILYQTKPI